MNKTPFCLATYVTSVAGLAASAIADNWLAFAGFGLALLLAWMLELAGSAAAKLLVQNVQFRKLLQAKPFLQLAEEVIEKEKRV
jgi:hypothetical protein